MERRSQRRRTLRRQNRQQGPLVHQPLPPGISGQPGYPPPTDVGGLAETPHPPPSGPSKMRVEMVARIRAERRNIAPEALTKHHLAKHNGEKHNFEENNGENSTSESPKAEEEPNFVSGLIKRLSDKTRYELVR